MRELRLLSIIERRRFRQQFTMTLANLSQVQMYWSPSSRRIIARALCATKKHALPTDAMLIGTYADPFNVQDFLGDLDDVIEKLRVTAEAAPACA